MTDRPINLTDWQASAALDGRLSLVVEPLPQQPPAWVENRPPGYSCMTPKGMIEFRGMSPEGYGAKFVKEPKRTTGDRLWVREAHYMTDDGESGYAVFTEDKDGVEEHLENMQTTMSSHPQIDWSKHLRIRSSIHMPRWASRLTLVVTDVRVMRVQEISHADARDAGVLPNGKGATPIDQFRSAWNARHAKRGLGWDANPWVTATTVTVHRCNIDQMEVAE